MIRVLIEYVVLIESMWSDKSIERVCGVIRVLIEYVVLIESMWSDKSIDRVCGIDREFV